MAILKTNRILPRVLSLQPQVGTQEWNPARVVLLIEREVTAPVSKVWRCWGGRSRSSAEVNDLGRRREQDLTAQPADGRAEIDIFRVQEISLVEQANTFGIGAP